MAYEIIFTLESQADLKKLDKQTQLRILRKIKYFESLDNVNSVAKKLSNFDLGEYRFRVGDYRIIFDLNGKQITVSRVQHRRDVYKS